jgi:hypothetical protein
MAMTDRITILANADNPVKMATKTHRRDQITGGWNTQSYPKGAALWEHREKTVEGIRDFPRVIGGLDPHETIIRGAVHDDVRDQIVLHRQNKNFGGPIHSKESTPRRYLVVDLDKVKMHPSHDLIDDPQTAIEWAIYEYLPKCFYDVTCFWQLSASAGIKPDLSCHIWFWIDRPLNGGDLSDYFKAHAPKVDRHPFGDVQPVYSVPPIFLDAPDPLPRRDGLMEREYDFATIPQIDRKALKVVIQSNGAAVDDLGDVAACLAALGRGEGLQGFHAPLLRAVWLLVLAGVRDIEIFNRCMAAINAAPQHPGDARHYNDKYIRDDIQRAHNKRQADIIERETVTSKWVTLDEGTEGINAALKAFKDAAKMSLAPYVDPDMDGMEFTPEMKAKAAAWSEEDWAAHNTRSALKKLAYSTPVTHAIVTTPGSGKSHLAAEMLLTESHDLRIHYEVPSHELVDETLLKFKGLARPERGRTRKELSADGLPMCMPEMKDKAAALEEAGVSVWDKLCKKDCDFRGKCGWSIQHEDKAPGIIVRPHEYGFLHGKTPDIRVIDESFVGASIAKPTVNLAELLNEVPELPPAKKADKDRLDADRALFAQGIALFKKALDAPVFDLDALRNVGMTESLADEMVAFYYRLARSFEDVITPDISACQIRSAYKQFEHKSAWAWATVWKSIAAQIDLRRANWHGMRRWKGKNGEPLLMAARSKDIKNPEVPTLLLDATLDEEIMQRYFPDLEQITRVDVGLPDAVTVTQITDTSLPMARISLSEKYDKPADVMRKNKGAAKLARLVEVQASRGARVGAVTYMATEERWGETMAFQHANGPIDTGHFGQLRGINRFGDSDVFFSAGRNQSSELDAELLAEAIFYKDDREISPGKYGEAAFHYETSDGLVDCYTTCHPDPLVERVRWQMCEGEALQAVHRPRGIRRTSENPLHIFILSNVPLLLQITNLVEYDDLMPTKLETMATRAVVPTSPQDSAALFPDLFGGEQAVKDARKAVKKAKGDSPITKLIIGDSPSALTAYYQRDGNGQKKRTLTYDPARVPDIAAFLTERLGPMKTIGAEVPKEKMMMAIEAEFTGEQAPVDPVNTDPADARLEVTFSEKETYIVNRAPLDWIADDTRDPLDMPLTQEAQKGPAEPLWRDPQTIPPWLYDKYDLDGNRIERGAADESVPNTAQSGVRA